MAKKEVVLIGAGKIGRGFMGDLFNRAGYKLTFLQRSQELVHKMREQGYYTVFMSSQRGGEAALPQTFRISGYDIYCTETERQTCIDAIANTNYVTIHVYPQACESIGHLIGDAVKQRVAVDCKEPLDIFMCVNFQNAPSILRRFIKSRLETQEELDYLDTYLGIIDTMISRNGAIPTEEMLAEDPLCVSMGNVTEWPMDRDAFKGVPPEGIEVTLLDNFHVRQVFKLWTGNMMHCCFAYYGHVKGYRYNGEAAIDPNIHKCAVYARMEAQYGVCSEYGVSAEEMDPHHGGKIPAFHPERIDKNDRDPLTRIGADPIRKLGREDRYIGPALMCMKHGRVPYFLARAAAMAYYFDNPEDAAACEIQAYIKEAGIQAAVQKYSGLNLNDGVGKAVHDLIVAHYYEIGNADPFEVVY